MDKSIIVLSMVSKKIGKSEIFSNVNISIKDGSFVSILGKSGSGKSTLTNIIGLLDSDFSGKYKLDGIDFSDHGDLEDVRNKYFGYIFQSYYLISYLTIGENLKLVIRTQEKKKYANQLISDALRKVDLIDRINSFPNELSGGEQQRVAIARAIINLPRVIIADEPTGALDPLNKKIVFDLLFDLHLEGKTIILITHDLEIANKTKTKYEIRNGIVHLINGHVEY